MIRTHIIPCQLNQERATREPRQWSHLQRHRLPSLAFTHAEEFVAVREGAYQVERLAPGG